MKALRLAVALVSVLSLVACGSDAEPNAMPNVLGQPLDVALSTSSVPGWMMMLKSLEAAPFGVLNESNWGVCERLPPAGEPVNAVLQLSVDRQCDDGAGEAEESEVDESSTPSSTSASSPTRSPTASFAPPSTPATPAPPPSALPTAVPTLSSSPPPAVSEGITASEVNRVEFLGD